MGELGYINGIGSVTEKKLNKLNIFTIEDLVNYYPYRYEILKKTSLDEEKVVVCGTVDSVCTLNYFRRINRLNFRFSLDDRLTKVVIFNRGFLKEHLTIGKRITVIGKYDNKKKCYNSK